MRTLSQTRRYFAYGSVCRIPDKSGYGGAKNLDMMIAQKIREEFTEFEAIVLREVERDVCEGSGHTGKACVVQFVGRKRP